jgi:hypothetical protein
MAVRIESQAEPIPGYKLIERLGGGGFGEVWKAEAPGGLHKAIKFVYGDLQTSSGDDGQRAEQELKALSRVKTVRHPYILSLERYDIIDGQLLIVMELADRNLWDRFRDCRSHGLEGIPREELLRYMEEAAEALDLMNIEHQLQHLDIKPQNLFLVHNHAKVADFGLVKDLEGMMASVTGGVTPVYAAPETFDGWVSRFCDQYSLAIVYQELLTGQRPFNGSNVRQLIMQHLQAAPNLSSLPTGDQLTVGRALSKNPDHRFPTCREFVLALRAAQGYGAAPIERAPEPRQVTRPSPSGTTDTAKEEGSETGKLPERPEHQGDTLRPGATGSKDTRWIRVHTDGQRSATDAAADTPAPHATQGEGVLYPALIVGIGAQGLRVMLRLREQLREEFGELQALPHIRWLYLDTDQDAARMASAAETPGRLQHAEVLPTKLNRPRHYLRTLSGRPSIDTWFDMKMLYRIPRTLQTMGMRALGRLAFIDNYRAITRRLLADLQACAQPDALASAASQTGLGVRTNQPKIYVVAGLAGGTGGGMFLDTAYVVRHLLQQAKYEKPEIIGAFLVPPADREGNRALPLGNTFAALTELNHFSSPSSTFTARYEEKEKPLAIQEAPFDRCMLVELPQRNDDDPVNEAVEVTADVLRRELATPLGRLAAECRSAVPAAEPPRKGLTCQVFGVHRISWPRRALTRCAGSRLCRQIVSRWVSKDASPLKQAVQAAVAEFWTQYNPDGESMMNRLNTACGDAVGKSMDEVIAEGLAPLAGIETKTPVDQFAALGAALDFVEQLVGRADPVAGVRLGKVAEPLSTTSDLLIGKWGQKLTHFAFGLLEQPRFRLAGAEEAVRQIIATIEKTLVHYEALAKELTSRAEEAYKRLGQLLANLQTGQQGTRRQGVPISTVVELLTVYPRWRLQSLILQRLTAIYVSLRGRLSDQLREINYCRTRLVELQRSFDKARARSFGGAAAVAGRQVFPVGCRSFEEAAGVLSEAVTPRELQDLDAVMQALIQEQFIGLAHVCMSNTNMLEEVQAAMQKEAEEFVNVRLSGFDLAEMYLKQIGGPGPAAEDLRGAFDEAAPPFAVGGKAMQSRFNILAVPDGAAGQQILDIAQKALPEAELATTTAANDVVFYREISQLPLSELEQLGPLAYEAYMHISAVEHFTPHSRTDIHEWRAANAS